jgi:hypothetical protein
MSERRFLKGDRVQFRVANSLVQGVVKEDRGPIGIKGRHLYLVEFERDTPPNPVWQVELPAVELQAVNGAGSSK